jgi:16S rRNA (adenine1518-N6/adenine1519-N6)-dimethyltransferase
MVRAKKHLGQHFLADKNIAAKIVGSLQNPENHEVLEIGPGTGVLTQFLIDQNYKLSLVEIDKESVEYLEQNFTNKFRLLHLDFLKMNIGDYFAEEFCIIGNFPYNISSQIFFKLLDDRNNISELVCMIQKEVAQRIAAPHGSKTYGILSVLLQLFYKIEYLFTVNGNVFIPPPKVKSGVICMTRYRSEIEGVKYHQLKVVVKTAFNQRRKTLRNSLKSILNETVNINDDIFSKRPEHLSPEDFVVLTQMIYK